MINNIYSHVYSSILLVPFRIKHLEIKIENKNRSCGSLLDLVLELIRCFDATRRDATQINTVTDMC